MKEQNKMLVSTPESAAVLQGINTDEKRVFNYGLIE
jgi:hypothetical protein